MSVETCPRTSETEDHLWRWQQDVTEMSSYLSINSYEREGESSPSPYNFSGTITTPEDLKGTWFTQKALLAYPYTDSWGNRQRSPVRLTILWQKNTEDDPENVKARLFHQSHFHALDTAIIEMCLLEQAKALGQPESIQIFPIENQSTNTLLIISQKSELDLQPFLSSSEVPEPIQMAA